MGNKKGFRKIPKGPNPVSSTSGSHTGIKLLRFRDSDGTNNLVTWREELQALLKAEYGRFGKVVEDLKDFSPDQPETPNYHTEQLVVDSGDPPRFTPLTDHQSRENRIKEKLYINQLGESERDSRKYLENLPAMFEITWTSISKDSQAQVKSASGTKITPDGGAERTLLFEDIKRRDDVLGLMFLIIKTHEAPNISSGAEAYEIIMDVEKRYNELKNRDNESVIDFYERSINAINSMRSVQSKRVPEENEQARNFIQRLNNKFENMRKDYTNGILKYPQTMAEALEAARRRVETVSKVTTGSDGRQSTSVFVVNASYQESKPKPSNKGSKRETRQNKPKNSGKQDSAKKTSFNGSCYTCGEEGHRSSECPERKSKGGNMVAVTQASNEKPSVGVEGKPTGTVNFATTSDNIRPTIQLGRGGGMAFMTRVSESAKPPLGNVPRWAQVLTGVVDPVYVFTAGAQELTREHIIEDNNASVSVFCNKDYVSDIRPLDVSCFVSGVGGGIEISQMATTRNFGDVLFSEDVPCNVLSQSRIQDHGCHVYFDDATRTTTVTTPVDEVFEFSEMCGGHQAMYCGDRQPAAPYNSSSVLINTVSENEKKFLKRDVEKARVAHSVHSRLAGATTVRTLQELASGNAISNMPCNRADVSRAEVIYGKPRSSLKGKRTTSKSRAKDRDSSEDIFTRNVTLHYDVMFIEGVPYFAAVAMPSHNLFIADLGGKRNVSSIRAALESTEAILKSHGCTLVESFCDNEKAVVAMGKEINMKGQRLDLTGVAQHESIVENGIKQIGNCTRAVLSGIPFSWPKFLMFFLLCFVVMSINMVPRSTNFSGLSPKEILTGQKPDYLRDCRIECGEYMQVENPTTGRAKNNTTPRMNGAIALHSAGNKQGSFYVYDINAQAVVKRDHFVRLPMPSDVIDHMNSLANKKGKVGLEPIFAFGNTIIGYENEDQLEEAFLEDLEPAEAESDPTEDIDNLVFDEDLLAPSAEGIPLQLSENHLQEDHYDSTPRGASHRGEEREIDFQTDVEHQVSDLDTNNISPNLEFTGVITPEIEEIEEDIDGNEYIEVEPAEEAPRHEETSVQEDVSADPKHRYNLRPKKPPSYRAEFYNFHVSLKKARAKYGDKVANAAAKQELGGLLFKKIGRPRMWGSLNSYEKKRIISCSLFLREKYLATGAFEKLKARLVAGGHQQDRSLYDDVSSPTVSKTALFINAAIAATERREVVTVDIGQAYLNADMVGTKPLMRIPEEYAEIIVSLEPEWRKFLNDKGALLLELDKALYGCIESARLWYLHLKGTLEAMGYICNPVEPCVFNKTVDGVQATITFHVDDLMITCGNQNVIAQTVNDLIEVYGDVKVKTGKIHPYLGMVFDFTEEGEVSVSMKSFVEDMVIDSGIQGTASTPAANNLHSIDEKSVSLDSDKAKEFHSISAKILYAATLARPDMWVTAVFLATRTQKPTVQDWNKLERAVRYLSSSRKLSMTLTVDKGIPIYAYVDASYGIFCDGKSQTGSVISLGAGPIYCKSSKHKIVTKSSTESELVALSDSSSQIIWVREYLLFQGYPMEAATVYQDNQSTIVMAEKGRSTSARTRHISIRFFFIKDRIESGEIILEYKPTADMVADILTKPMQGELFRRLRDLLMGKKR